MCATVAAPAAEGLEPPYISPLPFVRPLLRLKGGHFDKMEARVRTLGDIAKVRVGPVRIVLLNHPDYIEELLVKNHKCYIKDRGYDGLRRILGKGLLVSEGEFHWKQRKMMTPALHHQRIRAYADDMARFGVEQAETWHDGQHVDLYHEMMAITLKIAGKCLFNTDVEGAVQDVASAMEVLMEYNERYMIKPIGDFFDALPLESSRKSRASLETLERTIYQVIEEAQQRNDASGSLLEMLLDAKANDAEGQMTLEQVRDEALTLFLAGHETTALALTWTLYLLSIHPEAAARLHEELDRVLEGGRLPTAEDYPKLPYTKWVVSEGMRLYPPAFSFGRECIAENRVGPYVIRKGDNVAMAPYFVHRDPRWWDEPSVFRPERWAPEASGDRPRFAYFPFGGGRRVCIGEGFAWMEAVLVLAVLWQRYTMTVDDGYEPLLHPAITLRPRNGMPMTLHAR